MRNTKRKIYALIVLSVTAFIAVLSLALIGCSKREITHITIRANSFMQKYSVDAKLRYDTAFIDVHYSSGETEEVNITEDMVVGFDTFTTGNKTLHVEYKGFKSDSVPYVVYNPEGANKEILTSARLAFFASSTSSGTEYSILFDKGDLSDVNAIIFTIESEKSLGIDENCDNVTASIDDPNINYYPSLFQNEKKLRVLVYHTNGGQLNQGTLLKLRIDGGENCDIQISNIMISDGEQDYYLPKVEW